MPRNQDYRTDLLDDLRGDAEFAAAYLSAAKADSTEAFLVALRDVAEARKGISRLAKETDLNRENLYRALSKDGNPRIDTLDSVLDTVGISISFVAKGTVSLPVPTTPEKPRIQINNWIAALSSDSEQQCSETIEELPDYAANELPGSQTIPACMAAELQSQEAGQI